MTEQELKPCPMQELINIISDCEYGNKKYAYIHTDTLKGWLNAWNTRADAWQLIETAPKDETHIRGLWVRNSKTKQQWWESFIGHIDEESGEFVDSYGNHCGWNVEDFQHWMPLPQPPQQESE